jgi:hypothetical protein
MGNNSHRGVQKKMTTGTAGQAMGSIKATADNLGVVTKPPVQSNDAAAAKQAPIPMVTKKNTTYEEKEESEDNYDDDEEEYSPINSGDRQKTDELELV